MKTRFTCLLAIVFFVCALASTNTLAAAEKWLRLTSEHFDMLSCTNERDSKQMLVELEQFRAFFFKFIPQGRINDARPLIFVFDTERQYSPYILRQPNGKERSINGLFMGGQLKIRISMVNREIEQALPTIFHEYVHLLVHTRLGPKVPPWFNEGLAEVYETFGVQKDDVTFGKAHASHIRTMRSTPLIPLGTLFAVTSKSPYYNETDKMNIFYSESWLLLHYAMLGKKKNNVTIAKLYEFVEACDASNTQTPEAFSRILGTDYKTLEEALDDYLRTGSYAALSAKVLAKPIQEQITCRAATGEERDIEMAGLKWRSVKAGDVDMMLLQLLEKYPENPRVYETLAEIKIQEKKIGEATDYLKKAVAKNSTNAMIYVWLLRSYYTGASLPLDYIMPDGMADEYRMLVDKALELAPDCMEAYEMLALVESQCAKMRVAKAQQVLKALPYMREKSRTHMALAIIYWRMKMYDSAEAVVTEMSNDPKTSDTLKRQGRDLVRRIAKETGQEVPPPLKKENRLNKVPELNEQGMPSS